MYNKHKARLGADNSGGMAVDDNIITTEAAAASQSTLQLLDVLTAGAFATGGLGISAALGTAVSSVEQMAILTGDAALGAVQEGGEELMRVVNGGCEWW